jgi:hypothetical protein
MGYTQMGRAIDKQAEIMVISKPRFSFKESRLKKSKAVPVHAMEALGGEEV